MVKNSLLIFLPIALLLDLAIPFIIAPTYKGYNHLTQVMSVLGNNNAPLHTVYNIWLVVCGITLLVSNFKIYMIVSKSSSIISIVLFIVIITYAVGGCILSGLFSVGEVKSLNTISEKIHGFGSVIGFVTLTIAPLLIGIYAFKSERMGFAIFSICCFIFAVIFFTLFIMADKQSYKNTIVSLEGLWQRLSLLCMYLPLGYLALIR
ncbi:hypothetical protein QEW_1098 [Clostridioides difficile CD160]|nr:hypothetical protein QEW_1098 [Clostridioides difficile CD160]